LACAAGAASRRIDQPAGWLNACREPSVRAQRQAQRRHELPLDHVEEHTRDGVFPVEELLSRQGSTQLIGPPNDIT
jgi:hypothetical protein